MGMQRSGVLGTGDVRRVPASGFIGLGYGSPPLLGGHYWVARWPDASGDPTSSRYMAM